ncbi:hypothetical protein F6V25_03420 [Oryzomonas japonica]|uniref:IPT/TIG domain-containing protein n=1 Tax=Oryzomonas japonica TaxID=2603858 RepID=A0A7J4ZSZ4_9BACT|nr:hypothetical protein [Oryzomonas japonica]KAB0666483.1 hypothetical protein F6V25_03420 [Oryzomonas japonica]
MILNAQLIKVKIVPAVAICLFSASVAIAAPSIISVSGSFVDGQAVTISGSGFSANPAVGTSSLEFLGGAKGPIESGTSGNSFSRTNWSVDTEWGNDIQYSSSNVPWGTKVLQMTGNYTSSGSGNPEAPLYYKFPTAVTSSDHIFVSWWQRTTFTGNGQYKIIRFTPTQTIIDGDGQDCWFFHNNAGGNQFTRPLYSSSLWPGFSPAAPQGTWQRVDLDITTSGSSSGSVNFSNYVPGSAVSMSSNSNWQTHYSGLNWNYVVWQNYFGTDGLGNMTQGAVGFKDIYISHGTPARIELCDSSAWSKRTQCQIQYPTSWNDTAASIQLNAGSLTGAAYLYVVDSTGTANASGYPVTLGGSVASGPTAPKNLKVTVQ